MQSRQEQNDILRKAAQAAGIPPNAIGDAARRGLAKFAGITITDYEAHDFMGRELRVTAPHLYGHEDAASAQAQGATAAPAPAPSPPRGDTGDLTWAQTARARRRP